LLILDVHHMCHWSITAYLRVLLLAQKRFSSSSRIAVESISSYWDNIWLWLSLVCSRFCPVHWLRLKYSLILYHSLHIFGLCNDTIKIVIWPISITKLLTSSFSMFLKGLSGLWVRIWNELQWICRVVYKAIKSNVLRCNFCHRHPHLIIKSLWGLALNLVLWSYNQGVDIIGLKRFLPIFVLQLFLCECLICWFF